MGQAQPVLRKLACAGGVTRQQWEDRESRISAPPHLFGCQINKQDGNDQSSPWRPPLLLPMDGSDCLSPLSLRRHLFSPPVRVSLFKKVIGVVYQRCRFFSGFSFMHGTEFGGKVVGKKLNHLDLCVCVCVKSNSKKSFREGFTPFCYIDHLPSKIKEQL